MTVRTAPCNWPLITCPDDPGTTCDDAALSSLDAATRAAVEAASIEWLWRWTGRRLGTCPVVLRPCGMADCVDDCDWSRRVVYRNPRTLGWTQDLCGDGCRQRGCSCSRVCEITLPGPVHAVTEVLVDGRVLRPGEYRVDGDARLVRTREPQLSAGPLGVSYFFLGGNPLSDPVEICDVSQAPDALAGWDPGPVGGCYTQALTSTNPDFDFASASAVQFRVKRNLSDTVSFVVGALDGTDQYQFGTATQLNAPGQWMESAVRADGSWLRVTLVAGAGTVQRVGNPLTVGGDPTILLERFELAEGGCWPTCQEMSRTADVPPSESGESLGTWQVSLEVGTPVPQHGQLAAGALANELAKAVCGDKGCRLPARVQSVARQGVTETFIDPTVGADAVTGIWVVDSFVSSMTATVPTAARVFSPDVSRGRRTTWEV